MKYHIWTEGCQMNVADSERISRSLESLGLEKTAQADLADVILLNTCVVRQSAEDKALGRLNSLKPLKQANPELTIALMGCLVGVQGNQTLQKRFPWVDVFAAPSDPLPLLNFLQTRLELEEAELWRSRVDSVLDAEFGVSSPTGQREVSENLPIVLGCSHACAYCVIPHRRGRERSRDAQKILREARQMVSEGVKEVVLLGQIIDRYGLDLADSPRLPELLSMLNEIPGLLRIRFLTSHPNWMTDALIDAVANLPKVMPHIEVPVQAGDDQILTAMRRGYTNAQYRELVARIRERIPGVSIGTDIIVGFPGESEAAFQATYDLLADLKLDVAHLARYSPRPNTYSARFLPDDVPAAEKMRRFRVLEDLQEQVVGELNAHLIGTCQPVLFEAKTKQRWRGRTPTNRLVYVESDLSLRGQERSVKITWTGPWTLIGELAD
ncbi:MAG TPA: tRNA (N6-isopentenyl adenosine(37)-C2)-methylthiotransferase MiaB [Anaerolineaceae bacterium]|nr:tRNA (N6-isopentenyl adenosine(37)-C2)-methylthiotransferase MiaB [Anaerolineaceae bacterium]